MQLPADRIASLAEKIAAIVVAHREMGNLIKELIPLVKTCQKDLAQAVKDTHKRPRRHSGGKASDGVSSDSGAAAVARKPSGFAKPALLSAARCEFLGVPENTMLARMEVTKHITKYVKSNNLFDEADKRTIIPNDKLKELLDIKDDATKVTYFNLQSLIKHHFLKADPPAVATTSETAAPEPTA